MPHLPGLPVAAHFYTKGAHRFPPIFYASGEGSGAMASLNAGNAQVLDVGGGGINLGFWSKMHGVQNTDLYKTRHELLLAGLGGQPTGHMVYSDSNPTQQTYVNARGVVTSANGYYQNLCYVDVFGAKLQPDGNANNAAMLYLCPPCSVDFTDDVQFLTAITDAATFMVDTVAGYNAKATTWGTPVLSVVRMCLYSSGIYNGNNLDKNRIALAILDGLQAGLTKDCGGITDLEFPVSYDQTAPLFDAVKAKLGA